MPFLFAHHDMLESLDFLALHPRSPAEHALALAVYAVIALGVVRIAALGLEGVRALLTRERPRDDEAEPGLGGRP
jgi:hypothetical protein